MASYEEYASVVLDVNGKQAKDTLEELQKESEVLNKKLHEAFKVGNLKEQTRLRKELDKNQKKQDECVSATKRMDNALRRLGSAAPKQLSAEIRNLQKQLDSGFIQRGTKEWDAQVKVIGRLKDELRAIKKEQDSFNESSPWEKIKRGAKDVWSIFDIATRSVNFLYSRLSSHIDALSAKQESAANLAALTGLDERSIQWLTQQAEHLSTSMDETRLRVTQSSREILEAYMLVGSAKPELLKDAQALNAVTVESMRLASAAKMDLRAAVDAVTLSLNQYGQDASQAARFVNVLAAGSKEGAAGVVEQTAAIVKSGVAVAGANVSFEQHVGLIETLAEKGYKAEVAGTALKAIFLKLQSGAADTNPAIVGLDKALENLAAKHLSVKKLTKLFGESAVSAAQIILDNTDKVKAYTAAVTGTNTATEQAAINSNTFAARAAQARNVTAELGMKMAASLLPALEQFNDGLSKAAPTLSTVLPVVASYAPHLLAATVAYKLCTAAVGVHTGVVKVATLAQKAWNWAMAANPVGAVIAGVAALATGLYALISHLRSSADATQRLSSAQRAQMATQRDLADAEREGNKAVAEKAAKLKTLTAVVHDNRRSIDDRRRAIRELQAIVPEYHASITAEGRLINDNTTALDAYIQRLKAAAVQQALQNKLAALVEAELNKSESRSRRANALRIRRDRLSEFDAENSGLQGLSVEDFRSNRSALLYDRIKAYAEQHNMLYTEAERAMLSIVKQRDHLVASIREAEEWVTEADDDIAVIQQRQQQLIDRGAKLAEKVQAATATVTTPIVTTPDPEEAAKAAKAAKAALKKKLEDLDKAAELLRSIARIERDQGALTEQQYTAEIIRIDAALYARKRDLYAKDSSEWYSWESKRVAEQKKISDLLISDLARRGAEALDEEKRRRQQLETVRRKYDPMTAIEEEYTRETALLRTLHAQGLIQEEEYQRALAQVRRKYARDKDQAETQQRREASDADSPAASSASPVAGADDAFGISGAFVQLAQLVTAHRTAMEQIAQQEAQGLITHEQAMQRRRQLDAQTWQNYAATAQAAIGMVSSLMNAASQLMQANQDLELAKLDKRYDEEIAAAGKNTKRAKELEEKKQKEQAAIKRKYNERSMKIQIAQAIATNAQAAIAAYASAAAIPVTGWIMAPIAAALALAAGAIQIAAIRKQYQAQAAGYYEGGYTGGRRYRHEAGIVHEGEFVANHEAVENPALRPFLDFIDQAQRTNTVGSLTPADVSRALVATNTTNPQFPTTNSPLPTTNSPLPTTNSPLPTTVAAALGRLATQLEQPIRTYVVIDGPDGLRHQLDLYDRLHSRR